MGPFERALHDLLCMFRTTRWRHTRVANMLAALYCIEEASGPNPHGKSSGYSQLKCDVGAASGATLLGRRTTFLVTAVTTWYMYIRASPSERNRCLPMPLTACERVASIPECHTAWCRLSGIRSIWHASGAACGSGAVLDTPGTGVGGTHMLYALSCLAHANTGLPGRTRRLLHPPRDRDMHKIDARARCGPAHSVRQGMTDPCDPLWGTFGIPRARLHRQFLRRVSCIRPLPLTRSGPARTRGGSPHMSVRCTVSPTRVVSRLLPLCAS
jgi:hypothetical protein